jgi:hypothetical protein
MNVIDQDILNVSVYDIQVSNQYKVLNVVQPLQLYRQKGIQNIK